MERRSQRDGSRQSTTVPGSDMPLKHCWDCPTPIVALLAQYAIVGLLLVAGAWMHRSTRYAVQGLGAITIVLLSFWIVAFTIAAPRWGILWSQRPVVVFTSGPSLAVMLGLDLLIACAVAYVSLRRLRRRPD